MEATRPRRGRYTVPWLFAGSALALIGAVAAASIGAPIFVLGAFLICVFFLYVFTPRLAWLLGGLAAVACSIWLVSWLP